MFGIIDLASLPKDRFWLYRSQWNKTDHTLHVLPHWNWKEGQNVPVYVYTDYPTAELFVNGVSQGRQTKAVPTEPTTGNRRNKEVMKRFLLMWEDVKYVPGEIRVVAYDANGDPTCLDIFHEPKMHAFGGMLSVIVQAGETSGDVILKVNAKGLESASLTLPVK